MNIHVYYYVLLDPVLKCSLTWDARRAARLFMYK